MKTKYLFFISIILFVSCKEEIDTPIIGAITFNSDKTYSTVTDIDNNEYNTIQIGNQIWMAENLRTTKYNDGTDIPNIEDGTEWDALTTPGYCSYHNTTTSDTIKVYGLLYNWYAVNSQKLCPTGWHVPSQSEWDTLANYTDSSSIILKEVSANHWSSPNTDATNATGFTAIPAGSRTGAFFGQSKFKAKWWSSTYRYGNKSFMRVIEYNEPYLMSDFEQTQNGLSVRCVKD